jgi:plastocyanin
VLLVAGAVALAGCGGDDDGGAAAPTQVKVSETEFKITPAKLAVEQAGTTTIEVVNDGKSDHSLEVEGASGEVETDTIPPGESATLEVDLGEPGTYEMYCPIGNHRKMGMEGEVAVAGGGAPADDGGGGSGKGGY